MIDHEHGEGCGCDPQLVAQRNGFMMTLPSVLKDLWPEGLTYELTINDAEGNPIMMMGCELPQKGYWD
jgi:hypothetical protein